MTISQHDAICKTLFQLTNIQSYLMTLDKGFSSGDIISKFLRTHQTQHGVNPRKKVSVIIQEPLQIIGVQQFLFTAISLCCQLSPQFIDLFLLGHSLLSSFRMGRHKPIGYFIKLFDLKQGKDGISKKKDHYYKIIIIIIIKYICTSELIPDSQKQGQIIKLPKKANLSQCNNALLNTTNKIIAQILLEGLNSTLENKLHPNQASF